MNPDPDKNTPATIIYIPHGGGPMPLLDETSYRDMNRFLRDFPQTINKPDTIIVISAHWEEPVVSITSGRNLPIIYDYSGFPPAAYELQYPAPGKPELAEQVHTLLSQQQIPAKLDAQRGFDHGLYIPLMLMYPEADIPCIQISLADSLDAEFHIRIGQALAELKNQNLLIIGSGFSFHNMQALMQGSPDRFDAKNEAFEQWLAQTCSADNFTLAEREHRLVNWQQAPHARYCHPREEHLLPLHVCFGLAASQAKTIFQQPVINFIASAYQW